MMRDQRTWSTRIGLIVLGSALTMGGSARAVEWIGGIGDFNVGSNWQGGQVPDVDQQALINNGGTAQVSDDTEVQNLRLGLDGGVGTYEQTTGLFVANGAFIADNSVGTATISGGEFQIGGDSIHVGWRPDAVGVMNISGAETVVTSGDDFQLGREGTGTLNFSDGQLRAGYTVIGKFGTGNWNQSGGLFDQDFGDIEIGDGGRDDQADTPGPRFGTLNLSGGFMQVADHLAIGNRRGGGDVNISGGSMIVTGSNNSSIYIGRGMDTAEAFIGGPTSLRVTGGESTIVINGNLEMNENEVAESATLIAEITGVDHTPIQISGDAFITNGIFKVELNGYTPKANDSWLILQTSVELDEILDGIDADVDAAGYDPLTHGLAEQFGEVVGPFLAEDFSLAPLSGGLSWDVAYTTDSVVLSIIGGIRGDFNNDGILDADDINDLTQQSASQTNPAAYDLTNDGLVNADDVKEWIRADDIFYSWVGDANLDSEFDTNDLIGVLAESTYETEKPAVWTSGDWDGDGLFKSNDLIEALADNGYEKGVRTDVASVPEPAGFALGLIGLTVLGYLRRRG